MISIIIYILVLDIVDSFLALVIDFFKERSEVRNFVDVRVFLCFELVDLILEHSKKKERLSIQKFLIGNNYI